LNPAEHEVFMHGRGAVTLPKDCLRRSGFAYRADDKVMQIKNNYDKEVFNGDIGIIASVNAEDRSLKVNFDDRLVEYDITELDELVHAYATTIHKAQGSELVLVGTSESSWSSLAPERYA
jgi:exodeoxyribonuclease V alpha subunit